MGGVRYPVFALLLALLALGMLVVALQAATAGDWRTGRGFLYPAIFCGFSALGTAILFRRQGEGTSAQSELLSLLMVWVCLPVFAALPLILLSPALGISGAIFEMTAALTTTGGSAYRRASDVPDAIHLWRGMVGWYGGLISLAAAYVILAPRNLGGFEVTASMAQATGRRQVVDLRVSAAPFRGRVVRAMRVILPVYLGMTVLLGIAFNTFDKPGLVSAVHAMSIVSTSGITPLDSGFAASGSFGVEAFALVFMILAASRVFYGGASQSGRSIPPREDPELGLMAVLIGCAVFAIFLRHWVGALTIDVAPDEVNGFEAFWGALFTTASYITTTGFNSYAWESARDWSGLSNPGLILLGLCLIGGGAATTAGGIKLIRAYAMVRHGVREIGRIAQPHSVAGSGAGARAVRRDGAFIAWAFMMLYIFALMSAVLGLTLTGMGFTDALIAGVAALSNTGPAFAQIAERELGFAGLGAAQHAILIVTMILGRIETLAVIALISPVAWQSWSARSKKDWKIRP